MSAGEFARTERLLGAAAVEKLKNSAVILFGVGGVGSYTAEALVRGGIGRLVFVDGDTVDISNINRQLVALHSTLGLPKAEVMAARARDINPAVNAISRVEYYTAESADDFPLSGFDYAVDAIDMVASKLILAQNAYAAGTPLISCMGAGNKLDPTRFEAADIYETSVCPLARVMRSELRKRGVPSLRVVYSREPALPPSAETEEDISCRTPGSISFVPAAAGLLLAAEVIKALAAT